MTSRVLITGGTGMLGKALLRRLSLDKKYEVWTLSRGSSEYAKHILCDLRDYKRLASKMRILNPDIVFHLAANPNTRPDGKDPSEIIRDNIEGTTNLVYSLNTLNKRTPRFIYASSVTVFGHFNKKFPANFATPSNPISVYASTKSTCENLVDIFTKQGLIKGCCVRIPALVGTEATHGLVIDVIDKVRNSSGSIHLFGNEPGTIKPYCCADEVADIFANCIGFTGFGSPERIIVGNPDSISVKEVAEIIMEEFGVKYNITWSGSTWAGDNPEIWLTPDIQPPTNSSEAVRKTVKACLEFFRTEDE